MPRSRRNPCPDCGIGIVGGHMKRHKGSAVCKLTKERRNYERDLFNEVRMALEEAHKLGARIVELAGKLLEVQP